ncbi:DedA family protein [Terriglobus albidus]|uniref:DedA family protein n=1 Tax=Terriglobus albidus TaxID=1592106 RepID=UPI0021DF858E|nr:DedA family protein [Terriglobus albidus]
MTEKIINFLLPYVTGLIAALHYPGIALLMGIESACIPLPSEIIMPFAGYVVYQGKMSLFWAATMGALGCNLGSVVAYWLGAYGGRPLVEKFGRYVLMSKHDLDRVDHYFQKYGDITVLIGRLLPVVRTFIALPAGIAKMPQLRFHIYTFIGSWPWCFALAWVGMKAGESWNDPNSTLKKVLHKADAAILLILVAGIVWFVWTHLKNSRSEANA